ncbi:MAG: hypothetical protein IJ811_01015 [Clostridia bacterium]|nr:hypothetical protein [Clostridia bacterium]
MTSFFTIFKSRIDEIGKSFYSILDADPSNHNDAKSQDIIKAYILLCHSEFEYYFEQVVKSVISESIIRANKARIRRNYLNSLKEQNELAKKVIDSNNGIKFENVKKLLKLACFNIDEINDTYITKLNEFGKKRGNLAHNGNTGISILFCFSQEKNNVDWLVCETQNNIDVFFEKKFKL